MKRIQQRWLIALLAIVVLLLGACATDSAAPAVDSSDTAAEESDAASAEEADAEEAGAEEAASGETVRQAFGGGPVGGAYQTFANAMSLIMADANPNLDIAAEGTGGSAANLRSVNSGDIDYGISYAGDLYLGRNGLLADDPTEYTDVRAVAALYGGVVHLVVRADSDIQTPEDLVGKRFAPGNAGSGAALSAERFFTHLGIWDDINIEYLGYSQAASALGDGQLDGFWVLAAFPNSSVTEASTLTDIRLIDVGTTAEESGFYEAFPFFSPRALIGGTFEGNPDDVPSFQDTAIWTANVEVPAELVKGALEAVLSDAGLEDMRAAHPAAGEMGIESGVNGVPIPLHAGAAEFYTENGVTIPDAAAVVE